MLFGHRNSFCVYTDFQSWLLDCRLIDLYLYDDSWRDFDSSGLGLRAINFARKTTSIFIGYKLVHVLSNDCGFPNNK